MKRILKVFTQPEFIRFCVVGLVNTAVDLGLYTLLAHELHMELFYANMISTATALAVSYLLNASFTFKSLKTKRQLALYIGVTLFGLWVLQPLVITGATWLFHDHLPFMLLPKVLAIGVTVLWNYTWYRKVIFRD
jgi:putative flippase GtrA